MSDKFNIIDPSNSKSSSASDQPMSLLQSSRGAILKAVGVDKSKDVLKNLDLPKNLINYLAKEFGSDDFFVNKNDVTPEDVISGIYKV